MSQRAGALSVALLAALANACTELPDVEATCGNGVIESEKEDCDSSDPSCRPPGDDFACRRDCSIDPDSGERRACPNGWGCGTDSICRAPTGTFDSTTPLPSVITLRLSTADLDGDGASDLLANQQTSIEALFFDGSGELVSKTGLPASPYTSLAVGPLADDGVTPDEPDTLVLPDTTVSVYLGQDDRTLGTKSYASFSVEAPELVYVVMDALPANTEAQGPFEGDEIVAVFETSANQCQLVDSFSQTPMFQIDVGLGAVPRSVTTANLDPTTPCDELVVAGPLRDHVSLFTPCQQTGSTWSWKIGANEVELALPGQFRVAPTPDAFETAAVPPKHVITGDVNDDGLLDLLVYATEAGGGAGLFVSYSVGNGTFHSDAALPTPPAPGDPVPPGDGMFGPFASPVSTNSAMPLAVGTLTDDGLVDFVYPDGIYFSSSTASCWTKIPGYGCDVVQTVSNRAEIRDFNSNGLPDVVALSSDGRTLAFWNGAGDAFVRTDFQSSGIVQDFAVGDFDGDLLGDIALQEASLTGGQMSVMFGKPFGAPEPATPIAKFPTVEQIGSGRFSIGVTDAIDDVGVLSRTASGTLAAAIFSGSTDRRLTSPYTLIVSEAGVDRAAVAQAALVGQFDGNPHADLAVLSAGGGNETPSGGPPTDWSGRLWLLPASGEADLDSAAATHSAALPDTVFWCATTLAALDLDADGVQEVALLATGFDLESGALRGNVTLAKVVAGDGGNATFQVVSSESTVELFGDQASCGALAEPTGGVKGSDGAAEGLAYTTPVATADFDLDGDADLVTLGVVRDEQTFELKSQRLMLGRNEGNGTLAPSSFVVTELALSEQVVTALAVIQLDLDPELEIVLSTLGSGASSIGAGAIYVVHLDASGTPGPLEVLVDRPAIGMTVGDFDGNGIQDFAFGGIDGVSLGLGRPVLP